MKLENTYTCVQATCIVLLSGFVLARNSFSSHAMSMMLTAISFTLMPVTLEKGMLLFVQPLAEMGGGTKEINLPHLGLLVLHLGASAGF